MTVKGMVTTIIGFIGFAIVGIVRTTLITGTDAGSNLINAIAMVVLGMAIIIGILMMIAGVTGGGKGR